MKKLIALFLFLLPSSFVFAETLKSPFSSLPDLQSASNSSGPQAHLLNPVFADVNKGGILSYRYLLYDDNGNHIVTAGFGGFAFTYGYFSELYNETKDIINEENMNFYNITKGFFFGNTFGFGLGYSFGTSRNSDYDRYRAMSFGFLLRPVSFVSLGFSVNDIFATIGGENLKREERYSLSLRPLIAFTDRLTLSVDAIRTSGESFKDVDWEFSGNIRIPNDIDIFAKYDRNEYISFGARLPFNTGGSTIKGITLDGQAAAPNSNDNANYTSYAATLHFGRAPRSTRIASRKTILRLNLNRNLKETERERIMGDKLLSFSDIALGLRKASNDDDIEGLIINLSGAGISFAKAQELRGEIKNLRANGKTVVAVLSGHSNTDYYIAAAADTIYYAPNSMFGITGLTANVYFMKELMAKVGVSFDVIKHGKYKSVYESFTRDGMSPEARENLVSLVTDLNAQFISDIKTDRNISDKTMRELFEQGVITPQEAKRLGFIDEAVYFDAQEAVGHNALWNLNRYISEKKTNSSWGPPTAIAIVHVDGTILSGGGSSIPMIGEATSDSAYLKMIESVFADPTVAAVVIRISSGGGSAAASDFMQTGLLKLHKRYPKPVVFSFGDTAASGGYYIACANGDIVTNPGTLTGSIGVVAGKLTLAQLYEKLGITKETIKSNEMDDIFSESKELTAKERAVIQKEVEFIYDQFTGNVMQFRNIPKSEIANVAEGRVFTGNQALQNRLADRQGGLVTAIALAKERAGIKGDVVIKELPDRSFALTQLFESDDIRRIEQALSPLMRNINMLPLSNERALLMLPYDIEIK